MYMVHIHHIMYMVHIHHNYTCVLKSISRAYAMLTLAPVCRTTSARHTSVDHFIEMPWQCDIAVVWLLALGTSDLDLCVGEGYTIVLNSSDDVGNHHVGLAHT